jgi:HSP20 family protein
MLQLHVRQPQALWPFTGLRSEVNRLFDHFLTDANGNGQERTAWNPALDLGENDKEITIRVEVPGITPDAIDIQIHGDQLVISGEKKSVTEKDEAGYHHRETTYGKFSRTVTLPDAVDRDNVTADYNHGVLTVKVPKSPAVMPKKISIKAN